MNAVASLAEAPRGAWARAQRGGELITVTIDTNPGWAALRRRGRIGAGGAALARRCGGPRRPGGLAGGLARGAGGPRLAGARSPGRRAPGPARPRRRRQRPGARPPVPARPWRWPAAAGV